VVLQFEVRADGSWHSPQVPANQSPQQARGLDREIDDTARRAGLLAELTNAVEFPALLAELPDAPLPTIAAAGSNLLAQTSAQTAQERRQLEQQLRFFEGNRRPAPNASLEPMHSSKESFGGKTADPGSKTFPVTKSVDFEQRQQRYQSAAQQSFVNQQVPPAPPNSGVPNGPVMEEDPFGMPEEEHVGVSRPVWIGDRLLLARRVGLNGETVIQGSWLDWPLVKRRLLSEARDLLPELDLAAVHENSINDPGRMLAGLPVRLVVNEHAVVGAVSPTLQWALWIGWCTVILATAAAAALLHGVMALSERRAAFVSSVTHELRTPLTTFRLYVQMLAGGMVPDAAQRQEYYQTLEREAERLTLLVENVLAYSRLERGRRPQALERVTVDRLLERIVPRLRHRSEQANMRCVVETTKEIGSHEFTTDLNVVEQILFNLVDNAAKYARDSTDRRIHLTANRDGQWVVFSVRDHGPGFEPRRRRKRMPAFSKSAQESAESAPGVGLGLALCRRLARQLGGCLELSGTLGGGATATLKLPVNGIG
jgi:signal transduction histidine kinase